LPDPTRAVNRERPAARNSRHEQRPQLGLNGPVRVVKHLRFLAGLQYAHNRGSVPSWEQAQQTIERRGADPSLLLAQELREQCRAYRREFCCTALSTSHRQCSEAMRDRALQQTSQRGAVVNSILLASSSTSVYSSFDLSAQCRPCYQTMCRDNVSRRARARAVVVTPDDPAPPLSELSMHESSKNETVALSAAAHRLGVSPDKARRMVCIGALDGRQIEGKWFVEKESLERVIAERQHPAGV
jgi:hypothetical protein